MTTPELLSLMRLLSAMESAMLSSKVVFPDHLSAEVTRHTEILERKILARSNWQGAIGKEQTMTEPTDAELVAVMRDGYNCRHNDEQDHIDFARAVLAKWGTPQPVVREPSEDLYWELHGLSKILEGSGLIDESQHPNAYTTILEAMAFIRGHGITQKGDSNGL